MEQRIGWSWLWDRLHPACKNPRAGTAQPMLICVPFVIGPEAGLKPGVGTEARENETAPTGLWTKPGRKPRARNVFGGVMINGPV